MLDPGFWFDFALEPDGMRVKNKDRVLESCAEGTGRVSQARTCGVDQRLRHVLLEL